MGEKFEWYTDSNPDVSGYYLTTLIDDNNVRSVSEVLYAKGWGWATFDKKVIAWSYLPKAYSGKKGNI